MTTSSRCKWVGDANVNFGLLRLAVLAGEKRFLLAITMQLRSRQHLPN
jgi:hypothetical protein